MHQEKFFLSLMHPIGHELPISAHVACTCVCQQLYLLYASHALVQATVGVGTVKVVYIGVAYTRGGGWVLVGFGRLPAFVEHPPCMLQGVISHGCVTP